MHCNPHAQCFWSSTTPAGRRYHHPSLSWRCSSSSQWLSQLGRYSGDISDCSRHAQSPISVRTLRTRRKRTVDHCPTSLLRALHDAQTVTSLHRSHTSFACSNLVASARRNWRNSRPTVGSVVPAALTRQHQLLPKVCLERHAASWAPCTVLVYACCTHCTDSHSRWSLGSSVANTQHPWRDVYIPVYSDASDDVLA